MRFKDSFSSLSVKEKETFFPFFLQIFLLVFSNISIFRENPHTIFPAFPTISIRKDYVTLPCYGRYCECLR